MLRISLKARYIDQDYLNPRLMQEAQNLSVSEHRVFILIQSRNFVYSNIGGFGKSGCKWT